MARLAPSLQKIFGSSLTPSGNVCVFGSLAAGSLAYSSDPKTIQSLAQYLQGLTGGVVGNNSPAIQDLNAVFLEITYQIAYLLMIGPPEWNTDNTYYVGSIASDGAGNLFTSLTNANTGNALSDTSKWVPFANTLKGPTVARAWVEFDGINTSGGNAIIRNSFNVSTVTKNAAGSYTVNFASAMPSANYVPTGFCGSEDGNAFGAGDNGLVVGNVSGQGNAIRSATQCRVFSINPSTLALVEPGVVSVAFFG